ncbi:hypothetical protein PHLGIDRAFT_483046 [Phlebiopsis gigantea 11061_1 CR5-6]|uniref:F-box domain-containing protein n=1 Tax=Phlebiopsis gigantea (strain 11061_1 CR5-6) TaxID=745531 RepID=A0A0C3S5W8_PHLG1|nr:hypothetical protein PHLGIDRAFT_483046 [Phlebiopsis gigantea 11061_1 CR5-6]
MTIHPEVLRSGSNTQLPRSHHPLLLSLSLDRHRSRIPSYSLSSPTSTFITMPISLLSEELIERIIIFVYNDIEASTLKATSLVCRRWNAISRPFVLRRATISTKASLSRLLAFLSSDQTALPLIRTLVIRPRRVDDILKPSAWVGETPIRLPVLLSRLEGIEFDSLYEQGEHIDATFVNNFAKFSSVYSLTFRNCSLDITLIQALAAALPALQRLTIFHVSPLDPRTAAALPRLHSLRLVSVELHFTHFHFDAMDTLLPWLAASDTRHTLRSLAVTVRVREAEAFGHFLVALGPQIETLRIDLDEYFGLPGETTSIKRKFDVARCTSLRELEVYDNNPASAAVRACLAEIRSPCIRVLSIPLSAGKTAVGAIPSLAPLDATLEATALRAVEEVRIRYAGMLDLDEVREKVRRELPATYARGIVRVVGWWA